MNTLTRTRRKKSYYKIYIFAYLLIVLTLMNGCLFFQNLGAVKVYAQIPVISPLPSNPPFIYKAPTELTGEAKDQAIEVIKKIWRKDWEIGVAFASCESGFRFDATHENNNGTLDAGLFQVNSIHGISKEDLFNPYANAGFAYSLYVEQGRAPWESSKSCWSQRI